jgi:hypothetical protein
VVAASAVGILGAFAPEVEMAVSSVWWDGVLGSLEHLGKRVLSHRGHGRGGEGWIQGRRKTGRVEMIELFVANSVSSCSSAASAAAAPFVGFDALTRRVGGGVAADNDVPVIVV